MPECHSHSGCEGEWACASTNAAEPLREGAEALTGLDGRDQPSHAPLGRDRQPQLHNVRYRGVPGVLSRHKEGLQFPLNCPLRLGRRACRTM